MSEVEIRLVCIECEDVADATAHGWRAVFVPADEGPEEELVFYCPDCAARELD